MKRQFRKRLKAFVRQTVTAFLTGAGESAQGMFGHPGPTPPKVPPPQVPRPEPTKEEKE